jgi:repressor LexA
MRAGLTKRQAEALAFIGGFISANGYSPSYDEIATELAISSKSSVSRIMYELRERGAVDFIEGRPRSVHILAEKAA